MSPQNPEKSHRPRAKWHDYKSRGIYLITLVVRNREHIFGELNNDPKNPGVILSEVGKAVEYHWNLIKEINESQGRIIKPLKFSVMPDHFHGVLFVMKDMDVSVGRIINSFKAGCTQSWRAIVTYRPTLAGTQTTTAGTQTTTAGTQTTTAGTQTTTANTQTLPKNKYEDPIIEWTNPKTGQKEKRLLKSLSHKQRREYYSSLPRILQPLFDDDYDDTILYKRGQMDNMLLYVADNPRRAIYRNVYKDLYQKILCIEIAGRLYGAFGNVFLLKWPDKVAVWFHRHEQSPENLRLPMARRIRYEDTAQFAKERAELMKMANEGTLIVTAGISKGEQIIKKDCMENNTKIIHIQKDPISRYWKPEKSRFDYCATGNMLILAPLDIDAMDKVNGVDSSTKYSQFHNLNKLAQEIADFYDSATIKGL